MISAEYQWIVNQGVMFVILTFIGFVTWRVLMGHEKTGKKGFIEKWSDGVLDRLGTHIKEQTSLGDAAQTRGENEAESLRLLVAAGEPPTGAAYVAAKAVYATAVNVEQLQSAVMQATKICRLMARNYPAIEVEIGKHCDEIERLVKET